MNYQLPHLGKTEPTSEFFGRSISTTAITVLNRSGRRIAGLLDRPVGATLNKALAVIVPGYGKTKIGNLELAYYLALNGFYVIRYDHTNHVGDSEGSMLFTTLSQMEEDLGSVIDFAAREFQPVKIGVVGESLGARAALKWVSKDSRISFFVSLIGVFDVQKTLRAIYNEDGFDEKLNGINLGIRDIIGFQVDADRFIEDAYRNKFHSVQTALEDVAALSIPTFFFLGEKDPWVSKRTVECLFKKSPARLKKLYVLPGIMHDLLENRAVAVNTCAEIVRTAQRSVSNSHGAMYTIHVPKEKEIAAEFRKERRVSSKELNTEEEKVFWAKYLEKYSHIVKLQDYWNLLDFLSMKLGELKRGEAVLDAGCGIGNFGSFLLVRCLYQALQLRTASWRRKPLLHYVGADFLDQAVSQARAVHQGIDAEFQPKIGWVADATKLVDFFYTVLDLNNPLPFKGQCFDKICCNLVLSYVKNPGFTLCELFRTLKDNGRIVITSLKPHADLSQIFRNYIRVSRSPEEIEQARMVLSNAGMIRHKAAEGFYKFFTESELEEMLEQVGCHSIRVYRSFGDQANVAVAEKSAR